jgi:hypothetical protein
MWTLLAYLGLELGGVSGVWILRIITEGGTNSGAITGPYKRRHASGFININSNFP